MYYKMKKILIRRKLLFCYKLKKSTKTLSKQNLAMVSKFRFILALLNTEPQISSPVKGVWVWQRYICGNSRMSTDAIKSLKENIKQELLPYYVIRLLFSGKSECQRKSAYFYQCKHHILADGLIVQTPTERERGS